MSDESNRPMGGHRLPGGTSRFAPGSGSDQMDRIGENRHRSDRSGLGESDDISGVVNRGNDVNRNLDNRRERVDRSDSESSGRGNNSDNSRERIRDDVNNSRYSGGVESGDNNREGFNRGGTNRGGTNRGGTNRGDSREQGSGKPSGTSGSGTNRDGGSSKGNKKHKGNKLKGSLTSWMPWVFLIILLGFSYVNSFGVPFVYDRNVEENFNLFVMEVENDSEFPFGEVGGEKTDVDRISPDMIYHMGIPRYYVFVYDETSDDDRYEEFAKAVTEYKSLQDIPVFKLSALDADKMGYYELSALSPQVVELTRIGNENEAVVTKNYYLVSDWKEDWLDYSGDRKWYDKLLGR